jgi:RHS repeat-associated protein
VLKELPIYGSSRLGVYRRRAVRVQGGSLVNDQNKLTLGRREYELANHLAGETVSNVLATVSDAKLPAARVLSFTDYYAFGGAMPGRSGGSYRYGFNGKENDAETGWQDYGMRMYNPELARFFTVDPISADYPELTPYQFASNSPVQNIDLDGLEGCQYILQLQNADGTLTNVARVVTVDVHVAVTDNPNDNRSYRRNEGHEASLQAALDWTLQNTRFWHGGYKFEDGDDLPVIFKFNVAPLIIQGADDDATLRNQLRTVARDLATRTTFQTPGPQPVEVRPAILVGRGYEEPSNSGGRAATAGGGLIILPSGNTPGTNERADRSVGHEIIHGFYSYDPRLAMGASARLHNDPNAGGTGALSYTSNSQKQANEVNVNMILRTIPVVPPRQITPADFQRDFQPLIIQQPNNAVNRLLYPRPRN